MITCEQEINMASDIENVNEELIEELTATKGRKTAASDGKDRGRARALSKCPFSLRRLIHCLVLPRRAF